MDVNILFCIIIIAIMIVFLFSLLTMKLEIMLIGGLLMIILSIPFPFITYNIDKIVNKMPKIIQADVTTIVNNEENKDLTKNELVNKIEDYLNDLKIDGNRISIIDSEENGTLESNNINTDYELKIESGGFYKTEKINIAVDNKNNKISVEVEENK